MPFGALGEGGGEYVKALHVLRKLEIVSKFLSKIVVQ